MKDPIRILLIEDSKKDRNEILHHFNELYSNIKVDHFESFKVLKNNYKLNYYDLIVSDFKLNQCDGIEVLFYIRERDLDIPFVFVSDPKWEDEMIDILVMNGVSDYVLKDNLKRLEFILRREIGRSRYYGITKSRLKKNEFRFSSLVQSINGIVREIDIKTLENVYVSPQTMDILGYPASEWLNNKDFWHKLIHPNDHKTAVKNFEKAIQRGGYHTLEYRMITAEGDVIWIRDLLSTRKENGESVCVDGLMIDISEEKYIEQQRDFALESEKRRMKEQKCLWNITSLDEQNLSIPQLLQRSLMHLPIGFRYPSYIASSITYGEDQYQSSNYEESEISLQSENQTIRNGPLTIEVMYPDEKRFENQNEAFLREERHLLDTIKDILSIKLVKKLNYADLKKNEQILINAYELAQLGQMI